jgi:TolB-like protein
MRARPHAGLAAALLAIGLVDGVSAQAIRRGAQPPAPTPPDRVAPQPQARDDRPVTASPQPIATIAVLPFENLKEDPQHDWLGAGAADTLITKLAAVEQLVLVERAQIQKVLQEQDFQKIDVTDPAAAVRVGKVLAAQRIVIGTFAIQSDQVLFNARVVDVETAEVLSTASLTGAMERIFDTLYELADAVIRSFDKKVEIVDSRPVVSEAPPQQRVQLDEQQRAAVRDEGRTTVPAFEAYSRGIVAAEPVEAVRFFSLAIGFDHAFTPAYVCRGDAYSRQGRYDLAVADYDRTIQINPRRADVYYRKGDLYERAGRPRLAAVSYRKYVQVAPPQQVRKIERARDVIRGIKDGKRPPTGRYPASRHPTSRNPTRRDPR